MLRARSALVLVALCLGSLVSVGPAWAGDPPDQLASLTVSVWLEYDRPGELYIYRGELPEGAALPARITFRLPRQPSSTAGIDGEGNYRYIRPVLVEDGGHYLVSYDTSWPRFQIEYYDDALRKRGTARELELTYRADYAIDDLVLEVKEPHGASDFLLEPPADARIEGEDGLAVHRRAGGSVAAGQEVHWKVTYDKSDPRLAAEALGLPTPGTLVYESGPDVPPPRSPLGPGTLVVLALVGAMAVGGLGLAVRSGGSSGDEGAAATGEPAARRSKRSQRRKRRDGAGEPRRMVARYCHRCGASMNKGDVYCRRCGARRRGT